MFQLSDFHFTIESLGASGLQGSWALRLGVLGFRVLQLRA